MPICWLTIPLLGCSSGSPPDQPPTAEQLWQAGEQTLASGQVDQAVELFSRSLAMDDSSIRRSDAVVQLAAAGRVDLAGRFVEGRTDGPASALAQALALFLAAPPRSPQDPGRQADAYAIPAVADALFVLAENPSPSTGEGGPQGRVRVNPTPSWQAVEPVRLSLPLLEQMCSTWQSWQHLRLTEAEAQPIDDMDDPEAAKAQTPPPRAMVLWMFDGPPSPDGRYLSHPARLAEQTPVVTHLGSWPLRMENPSGEAVAAAGHFSGPGVIHLAVWRGPQMISHLCLAGQVGPEGFDVAGVSHVKAFEALLAVLMDGRLQAGRVVPNDAGEREATLSLAERLGRAGRLRFDGQALELALPGEQDDYVPSAQWLTAVAGYVRYGRGAD